MEKMMNKLYIRLPLILAIAVCGGVIIGAKMFGGTGGSKGDINTNTAKLREILHHIHNDYVDTANIEEITDHAIREMLHKLDPHTSYIPAKDMQYLGKQLDSDFEGIGISFQIFKDTLYVESVIAGGPSEQAGLRSGDKIIKVNQEAIAGIGITNRGVFDRLRGKRGTKVKIEVLRAGNAKFLHFELTRAKIPQHSVEVSYMINEKTGYIKLSRFGANAYDEFKEALQKLYSQGMSRLMIDLRDNGGGYMDRAINIVDELLDGNRLIVYTDGKGERYDEKYYTKNKGVFEQGAVIVLIDEESASASEIVAGALQDNDRALIVGRRSFGKGLVQRPITLNDGSELRLTISRYYTPSGRSIQKPYTMGDSENYANDYAQRLQHGELFYADSNRMDTTKVYKTSKGRSVYGGGGIMPDYFVGVDTTYFSSFFNIQNASGMQEVMRQYALLYANTNKSKLMSMSVKQFAADFKVSEEMLKSFLKMCEKQEIKYDMEGFERSKSYIRNNIKALIGRVLWDNEAAYMVWNQEDRTVRKAMELFGEATDLATEKK